MLSNIRENLKFTSITFSNIKLEIENFLRRTYNKADELFSPASPYGHVLQVTEQLYQITMMYMKNSLTQFDMSDVNINNKRIVRSNALVAGHVPSRGISSTGILKLDVRTNTNVETDISGGRITIFNKTLLKNRTNGLNYIIDLGGRDQVTFEVNNDSNYFLNIKQGSYQESQLTGTGDINQSFSIEIPGNKDIENFDVEVFVNGEAWEVKRHLYEIMSEEKACVVRTGFTGGVEVIFGNGNIGAIPPIGSIITVGYLETDGSLGNIFRRTNNDWDFIGDVIDGFGNTIDISEFFDIQILADINFGADGETVEFTRNMLPLTTTNFVLGLPQQYAYKIKRLGVFSHVNAYEKNGTVIVVATPNIKLFKNRNANYFTIDEGAFELDSYEISKIENYLRSDGNIQLTRKFKITSPKLKYYVMNVFLQVYDDIEVDNLYSEIEDVVSEYFLNFNRLDRVPKKDLINRISEIDGVDSVDLEFVSKENEDYHRFFAIKDRNSRSENLIEDIDDVVTDESTEIPDYNPNEMRGLDPILGDILFEADSVPIIRGGWKDRNGIYFSKDNSDAVSSINIIKIGKTDRRNNRI